MKGKIYLTCLLVFMLPLMQCTAQNAEEKNELYSFKKGDPNGIGKWYKSREIAHVMCFQGISWLERPEREKEESTSRLLQNIDIRPDDVIADIGAGSGYHVFKMADMAKQGLIYAVDIQPEMLEAMRERQKQEEVGNIELVKGTEKSVNLPENSVDKALMVDVYHEFNFPVEMIASIQNALRPDGKIYLIEYRGEDDTVPIKKVHKMTEEQAVKEMKTAGFKLLKNIDNLPLQHCMVFVKE